MKIPTLKTASGKSGMTRLPPCLTWRLWGGKYDGDGNIGNDDSLNRK